ncbi:hypothetical protein EST38_g14280 [Candolleomyces aberdarensis]|uniref:Uncharacterized protein n=1 Tax=Candolleomyces aberdarensis TaxID=2316362 RepID=A0A4Q2D031_9AGAR|nr:hypothetical protein EST38_g14280 [Candolleomyces aberdarensis]
MDAAEFEPKANLPPRYRARFNGLYYLQPASQFSFYPLLNGYFAFKFTWKRYLIKPQKLLRFQKDFQNDADYVPSSSECSDSDASNLSVVRDRYDLGTIAADQAPTLGEKRQTRTRFLILDDSDGNDADEEDADESDADEDDADEVGGVGNVSIDSNGQIVGKRRKHPDFTIESYWGAINPETPPDLVRIVVEVGLAASSTSILPQ